MCCYRAMNDYCFTYNIDDPKYMDNVTGYWSYDVSHLFTCFFTLVHSLCSFNYSVPSIPRTFSS